MSEMVSKLYRYCNSDKPISFFLIAGAGSGKTHTLIELLREIEKNKLSEFKKKFQKVAIITYTNDACDEIKARLRDQNFADVLTIHSFAWSVINPYTKEIKDFLNNYLEDKIKETMIEHAKGRATSKASEERKARIDKNKKRLTYLPKIKKFRYSSEKNLGGIDCLNHNEVIDIFAHFIKEYPLIEAIITQKYPILFIDECQDTHKGLMEALFYLWENKKSNFLIGLFGDYIQRIYNHGIEDLKSRIKILKEWETPQLSINYRSGKQIVDLANRIRKIAVKDDSEMQQANKDGGLVQLFIVNSNNNNKQRVERQIANEMDKLLGCNDYANGNNLKTLMLEHQMAATRYGFENFYNYFNDKEISSKVRDAIKEGSVDGLDIFRDCIIPLVDVKDDLFKQMRIVAKYSPIFTVDLQNCDDKKTILEHANNSVDEFFELVLNKKAILRDILKYIRKTNLFKLPDIFEIMFDAEEFISKQAGVTKNKDDNDNDNDNDDNDRDDLIKAWDKALDLNIEEIKHYLYYIKNESIFATQHGVKGLEFKHVMVVLADDESKWAQFKSSKIFDGGMATNLFYVACSRAEESLAVVLYTEDINNLKNKILANGLFSENEIVLYR